MDLEKLSVAIRPRSPWEAIDLGFLMARRWWWPLTQAWLVITLPLFVLLQFGLGLLSVYLPLLLFWWLKPIWERPLLYILSHALFGELPGLKQTLRAFPGLAARQWFASLTWRRFSPSRSMDLPVIQLENLKGEARSKRLLTLRRGQPTRAIWLTFICVHFETLVGAALFLLVLSMVPEGIRWEYSEIFALFFSEESHTSDFVYYLGMTLVAPFYVAAGFSLYLHRRIWLEGWDIEVVFRRLQARQTGHVHALLPVLLISVLLGLGSAESSYAQVQPSEREQTAQQVATVLDGEAFHQHETEWKLKGWRELLKRWFEDPEQEEDAGWDLSGLKAISQWIASNARLLFWGVAIALVLIFLFYQRRWLRQLWTPDAESVALTQPSQLFGMQVSHESLPDDVLAEVLKLAEQQQLRAAYALLYRATISRLMLDHQVIFRDSYTELECIRQVQQQAASLAAFFRQLTFAWLQLAYQHQSPSLSQLQQLCEQWQQHFSTVVDKGKP